MTAEVIIAIITLICSIFWALIIKPLQSAILELKNLMVDIRKDLKDESEKRQTVEIRLSICEEKIDGLERRK